MAINIRCLACKSKRDLAQSTKVCPACGSNLQKKGSKAYRVVVKTLSGQRRTKITADIDTAKSIHRAWLGEVDIEEATGRRTSPTLREVWEKYREAMASGRIEKKSWKKDVQRWNDHIGPSLADKRMNRISPEDIEKILTKMGNSETRLKRNYSKSTIRQVLMLIKRLYNWSTRSKLYAGDNPTNYVERIEVNNARTSYLSPSECNNLFTFLKEYRLIHQDAADIIKMAILTGRRRREMTDLKWKNIDINKMVFTFEKTKNNEDITLPIPNELLSIFLGKAIGNDDEYVFTSNFGKNIYNAIDHHWNVVKRNVGIESGIRFHDLRHTFASIYASSGNGDIYMLKELMGHKTISMTQRYAHIFDEAKRKAVNVVAEHLATCPIQQGEDSIE